MIQYNRLVHRALQFGPRLGIGSNDIVNGWNAFEHSLKLESKDVAGSRKRASREVAIYEAASSAVNHLRNQSAVNGIDESTEYVFAPTFIRPRATHRLYTGPKEFPLILLVAPGTCRMVASVFRHGPTEKSSRAGYRNIQLSHLRSNT